MNTLYIDTTSNKQVTVVLFVNKKQYKSSRQLMHHRSQVILSLITSLLKKHAFAWHDIDAITVNPGPGSYTGVRVGVSIGNALSYALNIPVNGEKKLIEPIYSS